MTLIPCDHPAYDTTGRCVICGETAEVIKPMSSPESLTNERKSTHGDWNVQAETANRLKDQLRRGPSWESMTPMKKEALDMIATKLSRICCGNPEEVDHWDDIAGYAFLGKGGHKS